MQDVPEYTNLSGKAQEAAAALQGLWADAWGALDGAANRFSGQMAGLKQDLVEGRKDINTVVDEVREDI